MKTIKAFEVMYDTHGECEIFNQVKILSYDHDKYILIEDEDGVRREVKRGYIVKQKGTEKYFSHRDLLKLPRTVHDDNWEASPGKQPTNREVAKLRKDWSSSVTFYSVDGVDKKNILQAVKTARKRETVVIVKKKESGGSFRSSPAVLKEDGVVVAVDGGDVSFKRMAKLFKDQW